VKRRDETMVVFQGFEFSVREFAGSLGDFGTLMPFTVGYIVLCGFNPSGLLLGIGVTNIVLALVYRLPLPVQPQKVIGSIALAEKWPVRRVLGGGFAVGLVWVALSCSKRLSALLERVPDCVVRGIQLGLAFTLALSGAELMGPHVGIALALLAVGFLLLRNKVLPASIFLMCFGFGYAVYTGALHLSDVSLSFTLPSLHTFALHDVVYGFLYAGFAQLFLTLTNAVVATVALVRALFPDANPVTPRNLIANMGAMNLVTPFVGGMPLCHGAGGLAAQYMFGARTGGAILMEGALEILLGLFFSNSLLVIFTAFPLFVVGVMLLMAAFELGRIAVTVSDAKDTAVLCFTALVAVAFNVALGFLGGLLLYFALSRGVFQLTAPRGQ
jgi:hypothetical protein